MNIQISVGLFWNTCDQCYYPKPINNTLPDKAGTAWKSGWKYFFFKFTCPLNRNSPPIAWHYLHEIEGYPFLHIWDLFFLEKSYKNFKTISVNIH